MRLVFLHVPTLFLYLLQVMTTRNEVLQKLLLLYNRRHVENASQHREEDVDLKLRYTVT